MRVRAVRREQAGELDTADWIDRSRNFYAEGETVWVPVVASEPCDREIPEKKQYCGRGYYMVGDIAVIQGREPSGDEIACLADFRHPRGILWIRSIRDVTRSPETKLVWGRCGDVHHRESGITYILDPEKVMFSMGNREEKTRLVRLVRKNERVADMFAGIGYFSLPLACAGAEVHAMEINPVAFGYLARSMRANRLAGSITPALGDCRELLDGMYDRVVMGHFDAITMLPHALEHVAPGSIIHVHSVGAVEEQIQEQVESAGFSATIHVHKVKKYRPHMWHMVQDVHLT